MPRRWLVFLLIAALPAAWAFQGKKKKNEDEKFRMVQGTVFDGQEQHVNGAVVQLKNSKTLQIRSFITREQGAFYFHGLDPNADYTLKADYQDQSSPVRTLSSFDSRKKPVIDLKLEPKK
ncbi:MAG: carboxypeptidase regulatory-like domain-containing protein [Candidatus Solibacter usitatus]|nr:carboxypeptidase regulatory-like domain-containing protein [Candidatus Solibacter usitatus]